MGFSSKLFQKFIFILGLPTTQATELPTLGPAPPSAQTQGEHSKSSGSDPGHDAGGHSAGTPSGEEDEEGGGEGHEVHEYEVFHIEFDRVEIPFIIALWIFVSSLAKIGKLKL